ncbi:MAG TPA: L,D-transpeptidase family protein [Xanthomonadales bacterium]|nr:L,D-transpeptidase family protein [Xanthomonadales bacterium]
MTFSCPASWCFLVASMIFTEAVLAEAYVIPPGNAGLVGRIETITTFGQETLVDVARQYNLGHEEIRLANPEVEFWLLRDGTRVVLPRQHVLPEAKRQGIVLNVPEMRVYYFPQPCTADENCEVLTFPVSIGRMDWQTPLGDTRVTQRVKDPSWTPPESIRQEAELEGRTLPAVVPPGPDNPMGAYALYLGLPGYRIHGTNRPSGVGMRVTHGCVRMYPEDIEFLYEMVQVGTLVQIVSQEIKLGWHGDILFMEVHPPLEENFRPIESLKEEALLKLEEVASVRPFTLVGREFQQAFERLNGMPVPVGRAIRVD